MLKSISKKKQVFLVSTFFIMATVLSACTHYHHTPGESVTVVTPVVSTPKSATNNIPDSVIKERVESALTQSLIISTKNIRVQSHQGIVYLMGKVKNHIQLDEAVKIAKSIDGVKTVVSTLKVENKK